MGVARGSSQILADLGGFGWMNGLGIGWLDDVTAGAKLTGKYGAQRDQALQDEVVDGFWGDHVKLSCWVRCSPFSRGGWAFPLRPFAFVAEEISVAFLHPVDLLLRVCTPEVKGYAGAVVTEILAALGDGKILPKRTDIISIIEW